MRAQWTSWPRGSQAIPPPVTAISNRAGDRRANHQLISRSPQGDAAAAGDARRTKCCARCKPASMAGQRAALATKVASSRKMRTGDGRHQKQLADCEASMVEIFGQLGAVQETFHGRRPLDAVVRVFCAAQPA